MGNRWLGSRLTPSAGDPTWSIKRRRETALASQSSCGSARKRECVGLSPVWQTRCRRAAALGEPCVPATDGGMQNAGKVRGQP
jgi:hypothetical protein